MVFSNNDTQGDSLLVLDKPPTLIYYSGLVFLFASLALIASIIYWAFDPKIRDMIFQAGMDYPNIAAAMSEKEKYNFFGKFFAIILIPAALILAATICTVVGIKLLRAAAIVSNTVIPPQDFSILAPAIRDANEHAITEYIRLSSLTGATGTFTKIGLTGLPLATILLTIILAILGVFNQKFLELSQLTLGAFIGSFVQRKTDIPDENNKKVRP
jgi:hypothetical protein